MYYLTLSYRVSLVKAPMFDYVISDRSPQKSDFCTILYLRYYMFLKLLFVPHTPNFSTCNLTPKCLLDCIKYLNISCGNYQLILQLHQHQRVKS